MGKVGKNCLPFFWIWGIKKVNKVNYFKYLFVLSQKVKDV